MSHSHIELPGLPPAVHPPEQPVRRRRPTDMLIFVPDLLGGLRLFVRRGSAFPGRGPAITHPDQLRALARTWRQPTVVLCGARYADPVVRALVDLADVYMVPRCWLRSVARHDLPAIAALAARLATAHRTHPIECLYTWKQQPLPF